MQELEADDSVHGHPAGKTHKGLQLFLFEFVGWEFPRVCVHVCVPAHALFAALVNLLVLSWTKSQEGHLKSTRFRRQTVKVRMVDVSTGIWLFLSPLTLFYLSSPVGQEVSVQNTLRFVELM